MSAINMPMVHILPPKRTSPFQSLPADFQKLILASCSTLGLSPKVLITAHLLFIIFLGVSDLSTNVFPNAALWLHLNLKALNYQRLVNYHQICISKGSRVGNMNWWRGNRQWKRLCERGPCIFSIQHSRWTLRFFLFVLRKAKILLVRLWAHCVW